MSRPTDSAWDAAAEKRLRLLGVAGFSGRARWSRAAEKRLAVCAPRFPPRVAELEEITDLYVEAGVATEKAPPKVRDSRRQYTGARTVKGHSVRIEIDGQEVPGFSSFDFEPERIDWSSGPSVSGYRYTSSSDRVTPEQIREAIRKMKKR